MRKKGIQFLPFISGINMYMKQQRGSKSGNGVQLVKRVEDKYKPRPSSNIQIRCIEPVYDERLKLPKFHPLKAPAPQS